MRRDMDLIRSLLLEIEGGKDWFSTLPSDALKTLGPESKLEDWEAVPHLDHHLTLIQEANLAKLESLDDGWLADRLTWKGCDFIESIRDDEIWRRTKEGAASVKGFTVDILAALAKGFIKKQIEERTGVQLNL